MTNSPVWMDAGEPAFPVLETDLRCEVVVVGAGISGSTAALLLRQSGRDVVLLDMRGPATGETSRTTAHVTHVFDLSLEEMMNTFGPEHCRGVWAAGKAGVAQIQTFHEELGLESGLREVPGFFTASLDSHNPGDDQLVEKQFQHALHTCGDTVQKEIAIPGIDRPGIRFHHQHIFHPRVHTFGLCTHLADLGGKVFAQSRVTGVDFKSRQVRVNGHDIHFEKLVFATHMPPGKFEGPISHMALQTKLIPQNTYVVAGPTGLGEGMEFLVWDTHDPYNYLRVENTPQGQRAILGGGDHKTGQNLPPNASVPALVRIFKELFPRGNPTHQWSGQVIETVDGLPYIGPVDENVFIITGLSGTGMAYGTLGGMMARDWVQAGGGRWADFFDVGRKKISAVVEYVRENADYPLHLAGDKLSHHSDFQPGVVPPGEGRLCSYQGKTAAIYQPEDGLEPAILSAVCTHMGCHVQWNSFTKTWDCPCHGSRFASTGEVLNGPAMDPLEKL